MAAATIISITGQAWARDEAGNLRELSIGDVLQEGETLITSSDGRVELDFADSTGINLVEGGQEVVVTPELDNEQIVATDEASVLDEDLEALLAALDEDGDLLELLDATAAGGAGGGGGGSHDFVRVARVAEETDPLSFETSGSLGAAEFFEFDGANLAADTDVIAPVDPEPEVPVDPEPEVPVGPEPEVPVDPEPEVPVDPEPEVPVDPEPEVPVDPEPEVPVDPEPEVPVDPEPEVPVDPEPEVPVDPEPEVPVDPEPEVPVDPEPEVPVDPENPKP
ncbi:retention module-containing protein, partial [Vreelandella zhanjiangensis]|uniref:retention module-containing protein n=1 Tax=Vreelandella zhanjiangensis TaxID=1121960 RepID=UPI00402A93B0